MAKARKGAGWVAGCLLVLGGAAPALAAPPPTVSQMLSLKPRQEGVAYSTPTDQERDACKVEGVKGAKPGYSGWLLRDASGRPLRRFFDGDGDGHIDVYSYYQDGAEVYRETDSNANQKIDQYRWLNAGGMKWGIDQNEDGKIDSWKIISAEEVSQEILQAVVTRDFERLQALWITDAEMKALELSPAEVTRIHALQKQAPGKFQAAAAKLAGLGDKAKWLRLESPPPQCVPGEQLGMKHDVIKQQRGTILYEVNGKHDWMLTGELIQVGLAWRLLDAPSPGDAASTAGESPVKGGLDAETQALLEELRKLDAGAPKGQETPGPNAEIVSYNLKRADVLRRVIAKVKPEERDQWVRQEADCYSAAAQSSPETDRGAYERLLQLEKQVVRDQPDSALAAYVTFREMSADYAVKILHPGPNYTKVQEQWLERLAKFVQTYPRAEDTPDALMQLGMVSEFVNKEIEAKNWYGQLARNFASSPGAVKAQGALRRLDLEGKPLVLAGQTLGGGSFDVAQLRGKVVVVYYWASWNQQCSSDFEKLRNLLRNQAGKGVELVCVNLDSSPPEGGDVRNTPAVHLYHPGGLETNPLATQYGIMVLPNLFLVDKDGKVVSRTVQINNLEDEVKKLLK
jgi:hypothetical protein